MKKIKLFISIFIILIIIISIILTNGLNKENEKKNIAKDVKMDENVYEATSKIQEEKNVATYITVENCINTYINYINDLDTEAIISILINEYKNNENITNDNVFDKIASVNENCIYDVEKVYLYDKDFFFKTYIVLGQIIDTENDSIRKDNFLVNIDTKKRTFEIFDLKERNLENIDEKQLEKFEKQIDSNSYNEANIAVGIAENEVADYYFKEYKKLLIYNKQKAYELLDEKYKEEKFDTFDKFENYIYKNINLFSNSIKTKYETKQFKNYREYLCQDNYNTYYIFREKNPLEYTVLLDFYTLEDEIVEGKIKDTTKKADRAKINLNKFFQMINRKDYETAYSLLDKDFKKQFFKTEDVFEEVVKKEFYEFNRYSIVDISSETDGYSFEVQIQNAIDNQKSEFKTKKITITNENIKDVNDIKYSFNIK